MVKTVAAPARAGSSGVKGAQVDRHEAGLPVVRVDDVGAIARAAPRTRGPRARATRTGRRCRDSRCSRRRTAPAGRRARGNRPARRGPPRRAGARRTPTSRVRPAEDDRRPGHHVPRRPCRGSAAAPASRRARGAPAPAAARPPRRRARRSSQTGPPRRSPSGSSRVGIRTVYISGRGARGWALAQLLTSVDDGGNHEGPDRRELRGEPSRLIVPERRQQLPHVLRHRRLEPHRAPR